MTHVSNSDTAGSSQRPYLVRALHDWCTDNGFTPYLAVYVDHLVQVPLEYVKNNEIVLNISFESTSGLKLGNEYIEFKARFGGVARDIIVPVDHVVAIYARENGSGMAFPMPVHGDEEATTPTPLDSGAESSAPAAAGGPRGLRLAPSTEHAASPAPSAPATLPAPSGDDHPDPPRPPSGAPRPALKRVK